MAIHSLNSTSPSTSPSLSLSVALSPSLPVSLSPSLRTQVTVRESEWRDLDESKDSEGTVYGLGTTLDELFQQGCWRHHVSVRAS